MTGMTKTALVAGAGGVIGKALIEELARAPSWRARALSLRPGHADATVADLGDAASTRAALTRAAADTTHVFYAALSPQPNLAAEERVNGAMLRNLLDGLASAGAKLDRVVPFQGAKVTAGLSALV